MKLRLLQNCFLGSAGVPPAKDACLKSTTYEMPPGRRRYDFPFCNGLKLLKNAIFFATFALIAPGLAACPAMKNSGNLSQRIDKLQTKNNDLERRVAELERKMSLIESNLATDTSSVSISPYPPSSPGENSGSAEAPPSGLSVVKLYPEAPEKPATGDSGVSNAPAPMFADEPGFVEPGTIAQEVSPGDEAPSAPSSSSSPEVSEGKSVPVEAATLYESAVGQFHQGQYEIASEAFMLYITKYPDTGYESSALFHLGECKYKQGKYTDAVEQFRRYLMKFPDGEKAPAALLRLGMCFLRLEDPESARKAFRRVVKRFPGSPVAKAAKQELENIP